MKAKKILIVEDEVSTRNTLIRQLKKLGYEVEGVATGELAVVTYDTFQPDIVFMDIRLTGIMDDGIEVAKLLQLKRKCCLIYLTGTFNIADKIQKSPHHGHILKPYNKHGLSDKIRLAWSKFTEEQNGKVRTITITYNHDDNGRQTEVINADELILIENISSRKHLKLTFKSGEVKQGGIYPNFGAFLIELNHPNFIQVSSGMAVNLAHNPIIRANQVIFEGVEHGIASISRNYKTALMEQIQNK